MEYFVFATLTGNCLDREPSIVVKTTRGDFIAFAEFDTLSMEDLYDRLVDMGYRVLGDWIESGCSLMTAAELIIDYAAYEACSDEEVEVCA